MDDLKETITKHQVNAGRIGGLSRSDAKRAAVKLNLEKARSKRWISKGAGPQSNVLGVPLVQAQEKEREMLPDSQTAIAVGGPCRQGSSSDQPDSGDGQSTNGELRQPRHSVPREQDARPLPIPSGE